MLWPPNPTSQLQPLHQGSIRCVKATYNRQVFETIGAAIVADPKLQVMDCWKSFSNADSVTFIKAAMDELKPQTAIARWKYLCSEAVNDFKGFRVIDGEVNKIIQTARYVGGEGLVDMIDEEVEEHVEEHQKVLTSEETEDLVKSLTQE